VDAPTRRDVFGGDIDRALCHCRNVADGQHDLHSLQTNACVIWPAHL